MVRREFLLLALLTIFLSPVLSDGFSNVSQHAMPLRAQASGALSKQSAPQNDQPATATLRACSPPLVSGKPLKVGTVDRRGSLALPVLQNWPRGAAYVFGSLGADIFIKGRAGPSAGLYLYRWKAKAPNGVPVFDSPLRVNSPFTDKGTIFQTNDKVVHGVWVDGTELVHTVFDVKKLTFSEMERVTLEGLSRSPSSVTIHFNPDSSIETILEISDGVPYRTSPYGSREKEYRPYDGAGIWHGNLPYQFLYAVSLPGLLKGPSTNPRLASSTMREVMMTMRQLTNVNLGAGRENDLITGSRFGSFHYYHNRASTGIDFEPRRHIVDLSGNAHRHPSIAPAVIAYPNPVTGLSDLIAGGEGALYYYKFTGSFTSQGNPIYEKPLVVLEENADLYAGTLPVVNVADWNGDGVLDIIAGNSEGGILFFKNTGTDTKPALLNGVPLKAGGHEIHVQPGYRLDIQGPGEARWGYVCPTVVDWDDDGDLDIVMSDSTARHTVFMNRGSSISPELERGHPIYCDGLDLYGMWRVKPAAGKMGNRMAYILVDGEDKFHLYWRLDNYNVEDGGQLRLEDGGLIGCSYHYSGGTGRCKLQLADWDLDGVVDMVIGTARPNAIPNRETGYPTPTLGLRPLATVLFMKNVGTNSKPVFKHPVPLKHNGEIIQPGGAHACSATVAKLGPPPGPNLVGTNETGRIFIYKRENITWKYKESLQKEE